MTKKAAQKAEVERFKAEMSARQANYDKKMAELEENIKNGSAGMKEENGEWHLEVGENSTYAQAFGKQSMPIRQKSKCEL